jgi:hypothetical protein
MMAKTAVSHMRDLNIADLPSGEELTLFQGAGCRKMGSLYLDPQPHRPKAFQSPSCKWPGESLRVRGLPHEDKARDQRDSSAQPEGTMAMTRIYSRNSLTWHGDILRLNRRELARIVPDGKWPNMWRVQLPDGRLTDMVNRTCAKDAATALALTMLNRPERKQEAQETAVEAPPMRHFPPPVPLRWAFGPLSTNPRLLKNLQQCKPEYYL